MEPAWRDWRYRWLAGPRRGGFGVLLGAFPARAARATGAARTARTVGAARLRPDPAQPGRPAFAGKKALLLPCVTLLSEGRNFGTAKPAISHAAMTTQRNLTANAPIPLNMAWMRTPAAYK